MPAPRTNPAPVPDLAPPVLVDPAPPVRPRHRALRPAAVATAAVVAVGLGSTVGTLAVGRGVTEPAAIGTAAVAPEGSVEVATARGAQVGIQAADQASAGPGSATPTAGRGAPTGPPTGTGAVGGPGSAGPGTVGGPGPAAPPAPAARPTGDAAAETAVLTLVNQERAKANCKPLSTDTRLTAAARGHSADMAGRSFFAHDTPDGVNVGSRVTRAGYRFSAVGENIAKGQPDAAAVMTTWMNSPGHRANILNCRFTNIGIGLARQGRTPVWTQDFGSPL